MPYKDLEKRRVKQKAYYQAHKEQRAAYGKAYFQSHKERARVVRTAWRSAHKAKQHEYYLRKRDALRPQTFQAYGGAICACCGEQHQEFLSIDHIHGGGRAHRASINKTGILFYAWLKRHGFPPGYRVLCMNCNFSLGAFGFCPHRNLESILTGPNGHNPAQMSLL